MTQTEIDTLMNQSWAEVWRGFLQRRAEDKKEKERLAQLEQDLRAAYGLTPDPPDMEFCTWEDGYIERMDNLILGNF